MVAIKNWFLEKNNMRGVRGLELTIKKETEKAVLVTYFIRRGIERHDYEEWIPKSVIIDEWEKDISGFGYHEYLEDLYHEAYNKQIIPNTTITSGYNKYRGDAFIHQLKNKELQKALEYYNIEFMSFKEWKER